MAFSTAEDVVAAVEALAEDYQGHAAAARDIAEEYLDSDRVLTAMLDSVGGDP
jgi:hypothetical protein